MLRKLLLTTALLTASGAALAHGGDYGYGRVVSVEPRFVVSFGTRERDGFRVLYESGGARYWTTTSYYPGPTIVLPPPYRVERVYYRDYGPGWGDRGWGPPPGRGWRHGRWDHRREYRYRDDD